MKSMANGSSPVIDLNETDRREFTDVLRSYYLFEKESRDYVLAKAMIRKAGLDRTTGLWPLLVKLKIFDEDENLDLLRFDIPVDFDDTVLESAAKLVSADHDFQSDGSRRDLTSLSLLTIDGQSTLDFDDALSIVSAASAVSTASRWRPRSGSPSSAASATRSAS